jgi:hypothetical protein
MGLKILEQNSGYIDESQTWQGEPKVPEIVV